MSNAVEKVDEKAGSFELQKMKPAHRTIAMLAAAIPRKTTQEIADITGYDQQSIARLLQTPLMKAEIGRLQGNIEEAVKANQMRMMNLSERAVEIFEENLGDSEEGGAEPKLERAAMTQEAWEVYRTAMGHRGKGGSISVNVQVATFAKEARAMTEVELTEEVLGSIKSSDPD